MRCVQQCVGSSSLSPALLPPWLTTCPPLSMMADGDGQITFEEFMVSYARPKPILKNLLIMVINTAVIYFILQAPMLDVMLKVCACTHTK